jgi:hypothetical protein
MFCIKLMEARLHRKEMMLKDPHQQFLRFVMHVFAIYGDMFHKTKNCTIQSPFVSSRKISFCFVLIFPGREPMYS